MEKILTEQEEFDMHQDVARSAFADMLKDHERNEKYRLALEKAINIVHSKGQKAIVLDIGTGTGLLSMMAVRLKADLVVACEAFEPSAKSALKIIAANGMTEKIQLIKKRSTAMTEADLPERANILVTEVFDTELIGEGAIETFRHAHEHLLASDCIVVPDSATIYVQIVESPLAISWSRMKILADLDGEILLKTPPSIAECPGIAAIQDIQLSQFPEHAFRTIVPPTPVLSFDWSGRTEFVKDRNVCVESDCLETGLAQVVFMWWELKMDSEGDILLSCAPHWAHPDTKKLGKDAIPWRDHWIQGVYFLPEQNNLLCAGRKVTILANHDEFSLWFAVGQDFIPKPQRPLCDCGLHVAYSRTRIGQMNANMRNKQFIKALERKNLKESVVLVLSEGSLLGLSIARMAKTVYLLENSRPSRQVMESYIKFNALTNVEIIEKVEKANDFGFIFAEPSFHDAILPWDTFKFFNILARLDAKTSHIIPQKAKLICIPVEFLHLHKIRAQIGGTCQGFDMSIYDQVIDYSSKLADEPVEAQALWEYSCRATGEERILLEIDVKDLQTDYFTTTKINFSEATNGIAFWVQWQLDIDVEKSEIVSSGYVKPPTKGELIEWDMHSRQGVVFLDSLLLRQQSEADNSVECRIKFSTKGEKILFEFK